MPGTLANQSRPTPSASRRSCSQRPQASSPTPLPSEARAPQRDATTAAFAGAPPLCGTKASACAKPSTGRSQKRSTSVSPRQSTDIREKYPCRCPRLLRAGPPRSRPRSPARAFAALEPARARPRRAHLPRRLASRATASRSGTAPGTAATTCSRTACCSRRSRRCCRRSGRRRSRRSRAPGCSTAWCATAGARGRHGRSACGSARSARSRCSRNGWLVFALGVAFALGALRALPGRAAAGGRRAGRRDRAREPSGGRVPCAGGGRRRTGGAGAIAGGRGRSRPVRWRRSRCSACCFPEAGEFPFWFSAYWPLPLFCALALLATRGLEGERDVRTVVVALPGRRDARVARPQPARREPHAARVAVRRAGAARRPARARPRAPARAGRDRGARVGLGWQVITPIPDTLQSLGDPSTERSYYEPLDGVARGPRRRARADRGPLHLQPLGDGLPRAAVLARARLAAAARHRAQRRSSTRGS